MDAQLGATDAELRQRFGALATRRDVANLLEISYTRLAHYVYRVPPANRYREFDIRKRRGGTRTIAEPCTTLKIIQRRLNQVLQAVYSPKPSVHGFVGERSIATNALVHARRRFVFNVDLQDFFPSINYGRVRGMFRAWPYLLDEEVATLLAQICCHDNALPQGAPTSPTVSNMICAKLDSQLQQLAKKYRCGYTRFADDITFSTSASHFPSALARFDQSSTPPNVVVGPDLDKVISGNGFVINTSKVKLQGRHRRQEVTGLTVNRFPNVRRSYIRQIRAMLHAWERYGEESALEEYVRRYDTKDRGPFTGDFTFNDVVKGKLNFLMMVRGRNDPITRSLLARYAQVNPRYVPRPNRQSQPSNIERVRDALWVLECEEACNQGTAFALEGYGLVTCAHVLGPKTKAFRADTPTVSYPVTVLAQNSAIDLAVLRIEVDDLYYLKPGRSGLLTEGSNITVAGYPNFRLGDSGWSASGSVAGFRTVSTVRRLLIDTSIVRGCSGGPVLDPQNRVIGIAVTGADRMEDAGETEYHGVIPVSALDLLLANVASEGEGTSGSAEFAPGLL